ncbi:MAG TPA: 3-isopropylmalate dehydratase small subunit [Candidatus Dormibacteraeota bacterium]|nr:3-isopropylmalate dehydratase small subunit [Candidatus Dormibacteraeota bacterium]
MEPFRRVEGVAAPLDRPNVDTDQIIPKQFLKRIERSGYGPFLFFDWRYEADGTTERADFELNRDPWRHAPVLLAQRNFGCGSSREHAVWALEDYGVRAVVAPSFGDIFAANALKVGLLPIRLPDAVVTRWIDAAQEEPGTTAVVDLEAGFVEMLGERHAIEIDPEARRRLLGGLDEIALALGHEEAIAAFEAGRPRWLPAVTAGTGG